MKPIDNKYSKWYFKLVETRKNRQIEDYVEKHHILPKSLGGTDKPENLIKLTAKEHYIAHLLLTKMYSGQYKYKMNFAFGMMLADNNNRDKRYIPTSRMHNIARSLVSKAVSNSNKGKIPWNKGIPREESVKQAVSKANTGRTPWNKDLQRTYEDKQKMKAGWDQKKLHGFVPHNKGKIEPLFVCEHCGKSIGGQGNYRRWHGEKCKIKK